MCPGKRFLFISFCRHLELAERRGGVCVKCLRVDSAVAGSNPGRCTSFYMVVCAGFSPHVAHLS